MGTYPARITRDGANGDLRFAIIPAQTYPTPSRTLEQRRNAIGITYTGRWEEAVDLTRQTVGEDGFYRGILRTVSEGILSLPQAWQGDPEMCSALDDADGTAGDFAAMHPIEECAQIFSDGLLFGLGLGQYLLKCWRCGFTDHDRVESNETGLVYEVCRRCDAARIDRPAGTRELFQLEWRDPRWIWTNTVSFQDYITHRTGLNPLIDGDGEWFVFRTVPRLESWRHGPWAAATLGAIFSRDAQYDAQNTSSVCAPTPVLWTNGKPTSPEARREAERRIERLAFDNKFVLDGEWDFKIVAAEGTYQDICTAIVNRCSDAFEVDITGNVMGRSARTAFTDAGVYKRTTNERRAYYAGAWARQIREKGLRHWAHRNFGVGLDRVPVLGYDVRSPEDKLADSKAMEAEGDALLSIVTGTMAAGLGLNQAGLVERLQRKGIRAYVVGPVNASVTSGSLTATAGSSPAPAAAPSQPSAPASPPDAAVAPPAPVNAEGRAAPDEEEDGDEDGDAARIAQEYTAAGLDRCPYHGRTHSCPRCGVRRVYGLDPATKQPRIQWRPIRQVAA